MAEQPEDSLTDKQKEAMVHIGRMMHGEGGPLTAFEQGVQEELDKIHEHEANYPKMKAASRGERPGDEDLGPGAFESQQVQQTQALGQQAATQSALQAKQAQAAEIPVTPPVEAPGPEGSQVPYKAQQGKGPPGPTEK